MYLSKVIFILALVLLLQSCSGSKNQVFWVSGLKTECAGGAGKMSCLRISQQDNLEDANWENFYAAIEGFEFEEGILKKVEVRTETIDHPPADGSSIKYILVRELDKKTDHSAMMVGGWRLSQLNDRPINKSIQLPELNLDLKQMQISGNAGCNQYTGAINNLDYRTINFGNIASTEKACLNKNIEQDYFTALNSVRSYQIKEELLTFYDEKDNAVLSFLKTADSEVNPNIHDIWAAVRIAGNPVDRKSPVPRLEINLTEMTILGNDGCNEFSGAIKAITNTVLDLGPIASTKKLCRKMDTPDAFNQALTQVSSYQLEGLNLILTNQQNEEVLAFLKVD